MDREKIIETVTSSCINKRLTCEKAHELARQLDISLGEIGAVCNELKIKITACRLGCF